MKRAVLGLFFLFCFGVGGYGFLELAVGAYYGSQAHDWPTTSATITEADLRIRGGRRSRGRFGAVRVAFDYEVDGVRHTGRTYQFAKGYAPYANAQDLVIALDGERRSQTQRIAYYDPDRPSRAVLQPGVSARPLIVGGVISLVFMAVGAAAGFFAVRMRG